MFIQSLLAHDHGEVFIEGDVLEEGGVDVLGLLEQSLIAPVRVEGGQLPGYVVMVPDHEGVQHTQNSLLIDPGVSGLETEHILTRPDAALIRILQRQRQQVQEALVSEDWQCLHQSSFIGPQIIQSVRFVGIHNITIKNGGDLTVRFIMMIKLF